MDTLQMASETASLDKLCHLIDERLEASEAESVWTFARLLCRSVAAEEIAAQPLEDLFGEVVESWRFCACYDGGAARVRVFNPDFEEQGWQSPHTLVMVLSRDMPFLIDSVRMELNRREMTIHSVLNAIMQVERDDQGRLECLAPLETGGDEKAESLIIFEVNRHTDLSLLRDLEKALDDVLAEVDEVTNDFVPMCQQVSKLRQTLAAGARQLPPETADEALAFLDWMQDHFTFLGYRAFDLGRSHQELRLVPDSGLGLLRGNRIKVRQLVPETQQPEGDQLRLDQLIVFAKSPRRSRVHRPAYSDYIILRTLDAEGRVRREHRFLGLYTSAVYFQSCTSIPVVRRKVAAVLEASGLQPGSHDYKALLQILEVFPRDDLFQSSTAELGDTALGILHIHERRQVRAFFRRDPLGRYFSVLVFIPRDIFNTDLRRSVQQVLCEELNAVEVEVNTFYSESVLARTQFILHLGDEGESPADPDYRRIEQRVRQATRTWWDSFHELLVEALGEEAGVRAAQRFNDGIPAGYREDFSPRSGVSDIGTLLELGGENPLALSFYRPLDQGEARLNLKVFHFGDPLPLSDVLPLIENLGLRVIDEHPYELKREGQPLWIHDFRMETRENVLDLGELRQLFEDAFMRIWRGDADNDRFNQLVLGARLDWREVALLRAQAAYMKQTGFPFSRSAVAAALKAHPGICRELVAFFHARLDPEQADAEGAAALVESINEHIDAVQSLTQDRILRRFREQLGAVLRTNYYQRTPAQSQGPEVDTQGGFKAWLSFKFRPADISDMPAPVPHTEIFVFSPRMEGVHLRNGPVARGGLRWSDRLEDYRTEVLGLVKAQQVKNAVILPVGAKGGFVCRRPLRYADRGSLRRQGIACYRQFISGLLDLADNLVEGRVVPPAATQRHDGDDPYLVVAADKGTASFSDIANEIAARYGFWLGDAFASGGSQGYDHKGMGITARGAWVAVQRHFRERGLDIQKTPFTVAGIGDMGGDVFGNGMLLSPCIRLVAAFNHEHIFLDPEPDPALSLEERQRLFKSGGGWGDYDSSKLSTGGMVVSRRAKSVTLSPEARRCLAIKETRMTPAELISAVLRAPVDLLWNGGIGTYVKSAAETHQAVGDKANDAVRINAGELGCRVVGEGGNLGLTQRARVEFCLAGGACNSDFIDNAAGVDCSDHEVNIKILLDALVEAGDLTSKQRNQQLEAMTEEVAELVLHNSYRQCQAISIAARECGQRMAEYRRLITEMESRGQLDRALEQIPVDAELAERQAAGQGLTRSELAVLVACTKAELKEVLAVDAVSRDETMAESLADAFPRELAENWPEALQVHRLRPQLIASQIANQLVNHMGLAFVSRVTFSTGADRVSAARAYRVARTIYRLETWWQAIESLDNEVAADVQLRMMTELQRLVRRASRWLLRARGQQLDSHTECARFCEPMALMLDHLGDWLQGSLAQKWRDRFYYFHQEGVPDELARVVASVEALYVALAMVEVAQETGAELDQVVAVYCLLGERLDIFWYSRQLDGLRVDTAWQAQARENFRDELDWHVRRLATSILQRDADTLVLRFDGWCDARSSVVTAWLGLLEELKGLDGPDYAFFAVASRQLANLAEVLPEKV